MKNLNMERKLLLIALAFVASISCHAQEEIAVENPKEKKWLIEPIKISSLMVNTHPEYNGWGFEAGRKIADRLWVTSMIEKTTGGDFKKNFDPNYDFLITFHYFAWLTTCRYYLSPDAKYSTFFDGGIELQTASHKYLTDNKVMKENAAAMGPLLMVGGELKLGERMYFKWRMGGFINAYKSGSMKSRIDDGQDQPAFYMYPHLSDAVIGNGTFAGDTAFGIKF